MQARAFAVLDAAWAAGVRYFDAARSYGRGEEFLAGWLAARRIDPAEVTVGSKWGYIYTAGWRADADRHEVKDHSLANLLRQAAESRAILGEHIDLYQIHSATIDSGVLDDPAVLGELARLKGEGLRIGLSLSGPRQAEALARAMDVRRAGSGCSTSSRRPGTCWSPPPARRWPRPTPWHGGGRQRGAGQRPAGVAERRPGVRRPAAGARGRGDPAGDDPRCPGPLRRAGAPWADVVLSGAANEEQLRSNLAAATVAWDLEAEGRLDPFAESPEDYWATRARMPWN